MEREKKLRLIQISLLLIGTLIIFFTYYDNKKSSKNQIITKEAENKILKLSQNTKGSDIFYNIEYSGLDLAGNRYILKSEEAITSKSNQEIVNMKSVDAIFYFKNDTILEITSDTGIYNNKTLDMIFDGNIKANYAGSELFAEKAEYSNSKSFLSISEKVKINDIRGTMFADKLLFNIKNKTIDIASFNDGKINANVNLK
tara:strand:- start:295 stop:894 length:600 start_codon:yes stop_codon:yes gene_type:complete